MKIICDWENCKETGSFKAPVEKDNSKKYRLLCLKHIKIFNKNWNYFENMNDQEIEFFIKSDLTWHKSTKTFGSSENFFNILWNNALDDKLMKVYHGKELQKRCINSELITLNSGGHMLTETRTNDLIKHIKKFLNFIGR